MIARVWHGWTLPENADSYQERLRTQILPGFEEREGYRGAHVLRRVDEESGDEVEFVTITWFDSMESVRAFSSDGERGAVIPESARLLLTRFDDRSAHYAVVQEPAED